MNTLTCGCEYVDSLILSFCELHKFPGPESHKDGKGVIIRDLEAKVTVLELEIDELRKALAKYSNVILPGGICPADILLTKKPKCECVWLDGGIVGEYRDPKVHCPVHDTKKR